jgi:Dolichyl-phosphate-mannose-protein mannosyltransferase
MPETSPVRQIGLTRSQQLAVWLAAGVVVYIYLTYGIGRSLWLDEANTVYIANGSPKQIIDSLSRDVSPPVYYFLLSGWMRLFGASEIALRLPSVLFYLAGICLMWFLGRMLLGVEGAGLVSFIYAINPIAGRQAQNVRMYTMLALMVALSMIVFIILIRDQERRVPRWFALFGLIAFVGLNTHYWFVFVLIAYGSWVISTRRSWSVRDLGLLATFTFLPFLVVDLAMFLHQTQLPASLWTPRPTLGDLMRVFVANFGFIHLHSARAIVSTIVLSSPIVWSIFVRRCNWQAAVLHSAFFASFLYAVALGVPFLVSMRKPIFWPGRYDIIAVPFFALFAASLLLCMPVRPRILFQLLLAGSCAVYFVQSVRESQTTNELATLDPVPLGDRAAASAICAESTLGDLVIYTGLSRAAVSYYLQRFGCSQRLREVSYPAEVEQHLGWLDKRRDYSQEPAIRREGESVAATAYTSNARIFLLFQPDKQLSAGIVGPIERRFRLAFSRRFISCAWCFYELRVYRPNSVKRNTGAF